MCYYIIQNIIETIRHLVPRLLLQRFGRWSLGATLALPRRRTECRLDFHHVTVSRGHIMAPAGPSVRLNVSRCVIARAIRSPDRSGSLRGPRHLRPATSIYCTRSSHGFLCRLAELRPRIRECLTPRVYLASQSNAISHVA